MTDFIPEPQSRGFQIHWNGVPGRIPVPHFVVGYLTVDLGGRQSRVYLSVLLFPVSLFQVRHLTSLCPSSSFVSWRVITPALEECRRWCHESKGPRRVMTHDEVPQVLASTSCSQFSSKVAFMWFSYFKTSWLEQRPFLKFEIRSHDGTVTILTSAWASASVICFSCKVLRL